MNRKLLIILRRCCWRLLHARAEAASGLYVGAGSAARP